jgi:pimeloyl-ACP methyl ester carboxylesterase
VLHCNPDETIQPASISGVLTLPEGPVTCAIMLPGTASDDRFVRSVFARPLAAVGIDLIVPPLRRGADVIADYREALDRAALLSGPLLVGGISLGAHVAARWATRTPVRRLAGLLLALPAWTGPSDGAPAALTARLTAAQVRSGGRAAALASAAAGAPPWLAAELGRAWPRHGDGLAPALEAAAAESGPTVDELAGLDVPTGMVALVDDPVHPLAVAEQWQRLLPRSTLVTTRLGAFGHDRETVGRAAVLAWLRAAHGR